VESGLFADERGRDLDFVERDSQSLAESHEAYDRQRPLAIATIRRGTQKALAFAQLDRFDGFAGRLGQGLDAHMAWLHEASTS
jgi:hypothetical protein